MDDKKQQFPSILHIVGSSAFGGGTMVILSLAKDAQRRGCKVAILTDEPNTIKAAKQQNIDIVEFHGIIRSIRPWTDMKAAQRLTKLLEERKETIVHTHTLKGGLIGRIAAYRAKVPIIIYHSHGLSFQDGSILRKKIITSCEKYAVKKCDNIISVNQSDIDVYVESGIAPKEKLTYIPNGINLEQIDNVPTVQREQLVKSLNIPENSFLVVVVARLFSEKGHLWLFKALPAVQKNLKRPVHLIVLGDGPHREMYQHEVEKLGVGDKVHFMGHRFDGPAITKACDLFVLPSLREGHSITILEAMAMQIPIVATNIRGINNSLRNEQEGLLVPVRNSDLLARAIVQIATQPQLALKFKEAARKRFLEEFTESTMLNRVWQLYNQIASVKNLF